MKKMKIGIIGMGPTGMGASLRLYDYIQQLKIEEQGQLEVHIMEQGEKAGGQVKSFIDPVDKKISELGAVIIFPSWKEVHYLIDRFRMPTKIAPFASQRFSLKGKSASPLVPFLKTIRFFKELYRYNKLLSSPAYVKMYKEGTQFVPDDLIKDVKSWAKNNKVTSVVSFFQEFYSGCGYGQNIWTQPALYVSLLMTPQVVLSLIKNAFGKHGAISLVEGYQALWIKMSETLAQQKSMYFHYRTKVEKVVRVVLPNGENKTRMHLVQLNSQGQKIGARVEHFDKVILTASPSNIVKILSSEDPSRSVSAIKKTLTQSLNSNYQVIVGDWDYKREKKFIHTGSTRFFQESYHARANEKYAPVLDIMMNPYERPLNHTEEKRPISNNHMLYVYGKSGDVAISDECVKEKLEEYGGHVKNIIHKEVWNDYHPHYDIDRIEAGDIKKIHQFNRANPDLQIVGSITEMGFTEATVRQGKIAAENIIQSLKRASCKKKGNYSKLLRWRFPRFLRKPALTIPFIF